MHLQAQLLLEAQDGIDKVANDVVGERSNKFDNLRGNNSANQGGRNFNQVSVQFMTIN